MNYAQIFTCDIARWSPACRSASLFVSGCTHRCKECFNEIAWDFNYGRAIYPGCTGHVIQRTAGSVLYQRIYISWRRTDGGFRIKRRYVRIHLKAIRKAAYPDKDIWMLYRIHFTKSLWIRLIKNVTGMTPMPFLQ